MRLPYCADMQVPGSPKSARTLPSVAWPDVTRERTMLLEYMERVETQHAEMQHSEMASALRASQACEIELQRQLDAVKTQLWRARNETGREGSPKPSRSSKRSMCNVPNE
jgi:hypothetical protein